MAKLLPPEPAHERASCQPPVGALACPTMHPLPARPCGRAGRGQGLLVAVFSLLSAALLVGSFFKASDSLRPTELRRAIDAGQEWEEAIRMFASVAPAVPRGFPTATEPLPEELAVAKCHSFNAAYSAMHRRTLAAPRNSPNYRLAVADKASHGGLADFITGSVGKSAASSVSSISRAHFRWLVLGCKRWTAGRKLQQRPRMQGHSCGRQWRTVHTSCTGRCQRGYSIPHTSILHTLRTPAT